MKTSVAVQSFGSTRKLAEALGLSVQAIYKWGDDVPALREYQIRDLLAERNRAPVESCEHQAAA